MKKDSLLNAGKAAIIGYLYRCFFTKVLRGNEGRIRAFLLRMTCRKITITDTTTMWWIRDSHSFLPKFFSYYYTDYCRTTQTLKHEYVSGRWVSIDGILGYMHSDHGSVISTLYIPKCLYNRIEGRLCDLLKPRKKDHTPNFNLTYDNIWMQDHSVFLPKSLDDIPIHSHVKKTLRDHIEKMKTEWYSDNTTYSRNLLFYGPKGTGKTNIIGAIASELKSNCYQFPLPEKATDFRHAVKQIDRCSVICCDEVDEVPQFKKADLVFKDGAFSKRSALDFFAGINMPVGCMTIVATNYPENLDDRFRRKGRFKEDICIENVDSAGIIEWLKNVHHYDVPPGVILKEMDCATIFDEMDTLDDPELFVEKHKC